jgi:hypothetical protein
VIGFLALAQLLEPPFVTKTGPVHEIFYVVFKQFDCFEYGLKLFDDLESITSFPVSLVCGFEFLEVIG